MITENQIKLIKRLLSTAPEQPKYDPSNCGYHGDLGRYDFWDFWRKAMELSDVSSYGRHMAWLDACYQSLVDAKTKDANLNIRPVEKNEDRGMAQGPIWYAEGWNDEAKLIGLKTIDYKVPIKRR